MKQLQWLGGKADTRRGPMLVMLGKWTDWLNGLAWMGKGTLPPKTSSFVNGTAMYCAVLGFKES